MTATPESVYMDVSDDLDAPKAKTLLSLPSELIIHVLSYLPPISLSAALLTCRRLHDHGVTDSLWAGHLSSLELTSPQPYLSYRKLHHSLAPYLFLPRKVFISDRKSSGQLLVSKYNSASGTVEAHQLIEDKSSSPLPRYQLWSMDSAVTICCRSPKIGLWEEAVLQLSPSSDKSASGEIHQPKGQHSSASVHTTFFRARAFLEKDAHPSMSVWPPRTIPSKERVRNESASDFTAASHMPQRQGGVVFNLAYARESSAFPSVEEGGSGMEGFDAQSVKKPASSPWSVENRAQSGYASEKSFRMRKWAAFERTSHNPRLKIGETVYTFSEVDKELWTPTREHPLRGIWTGDYSAHGNEFVLFHQPPVQTGSTARRLEVIKLTGDPNVPRGEYSFIIDNIDPDAAIRIADSDEFEWPGAHVFEGRGQIANTDFRNSKFIEVELIIPPASTRINVTGALLSHSESVLPVDERTSVATKESVYEPWVQSEVALYWKEYSDIRLFRRVNVNSFFDV